MPGGGIASRVRSPVTGLSLAAMLLFGLIAGGCAVRARSRLTPEAQQNIAATQEQLRLRMRSLVDPTCRRLSDQIAAALRSATFSGDIPRVRAFAKKWAAEHPVQGSIAERESVVAHLSEFENAEGLTAGQTVAALNTTMDDLNRKTGVYSDQLFRQARWEIERFKLEWAAELRLDEAIPLATRAAESAERAAGTVDRLAPEVERSLAVAQAAPQLVTSEREAALHAIHGELDRSLHFVDGQRIAAFNQLAKERGVAIADMSDIIARQRTQLAADADRIAGRQIDYAVQKVTRLLTLAMTAGLLMVVVGLLLARRFPPARRRVEPRRADLINVRDLARQGDREAPMNMRAQSGGN